MQTTHPAPGVVRELWLAEHYWPDLDVPSAWARATRAQHVLPPVRWVTSLLLPGERTVFGLFAATNAADVARALAQVDVAADRVGVALHLPAADPRWEPHGRDHRS